MHGDDELVRDVRSGDREAYGLLFARHHDVARRVAARNGAVGEADDVVAEIFARTLVQIQAGRGPRVSFRAYLLTAVRHEAGHRAAQARRCEPVEDIEPFAGSVELPEIDDRVRAAYAVLPDRWRHTLWQLEVEGIRPRELALELGLTPNAVSALGCRARAALRAAYLEHPDAA